MKRGDCVEVTDRVFGRVVQGWLWRVFTDHEHPTEPGCTMYSVLPFNEAGTENVWEGRVATEIVGPPVRDAFAMLLGAP